MSAVTLDSRGQGSPGLLPPSAEGALGTSWGPPGAATDRGHRFGPRAWVGGPLASPTLSYLNPPTSAHPALCACPWLCSWGTTPAPARPSQHTPHPPPRKPQQQTRSMSHQPGQEQKEHQNQGCSQGHRGHQVRVLGTKDGIVKGTVEGSRGTRQLGVRDLLPGGPWLAHLWEGREGQDFLWEGTLSACPSHPSGHSR